MDAVSKNKLMPWILIPAYQPAEILLEVVNSLICNGFLRILIVNDGSDGHHRHIFDQLSKRTEVTLLEHAVNRGKGAALKTGINHYLLHSANSPGLITLDADGQHNPEDAGRVAIRASKNPEALIIGAREFDSTQRVPLRSRLGNLATRHVFRLLVGKNISDTQTGLRYLPNGFLADCLRIGPNGYEYELEMLIRAISVKIGVIEVPIRTVYFGENESSHFHPLIDSMRVYFVFLRFASTSIITALIDYLVFIVALFVSSSVAGALIAARLFAGAFQFVAVKNFVFHSRRRASVELPTYVFAVAAITVMSYLGISLFTRALGWGIITSKVATEIIMFSISFLAMRLFVFRDAEERISNKTDWTSYYKKPAFASKYTRKYTGAMLLRLMKEHASRTATSFAELGGAGSFIFPAIRAAYPGCRYTIVDNNQCGLDAFVDANPDAHNVQVINADIENALEAAGNDVTFSIGLIEHFDPDATSRVIARHFAVTSDGGLVIMTFPTPTVLYSVTRKIAELLGMWNFPDERPLTFSEVKAAIGGRGEIIHEFINWYAVLTQGVVVARKKASFSAAGDGS